MFVCLFVFVCFLFFVIVIVSFHVFLLHGLAWGAVEISPEDIAPRNTSFPPRSPSLAPTPSRVHPRTTEQVFQQDALGFRRLEHALPPISPGKASTSTTEPLPEVGDSLYVVGTSFIVVI